MSDFHNMNLNKYAGYLMLPPVPSKAEMLERGPPLWSAVYPPAGSSLQHAHQLQLLSHQQLLRQHELYMIQHQTAQVIELQRNAQLVVRVSRLCRCNHSRAEVLLCFSFRRSGGCNAFWEMKIKYANVLSCCDAAVHFR